MDLIEFIDWYFSEENEDFDLVNNDALILQILEENPFFSKLSQFIEKKPHIVKKFNRIPTTLSIFDYLIEFIYEVILFIVEFLGTLKDFTLIQESFEHIELKKDEFITSYGYIHEELYKKLSSHLENLISSHLIDLDGTLSCYFNIMDNSLSIDSKFQTIMILVEINTFVKTISDKIPITELESLKEIDLVQKLNLSNKNRLWEYFHSWCLNLSNLIEDNYKSCIFTLLAIRDLINNHHTSRLAFFNVEKKTLWEVYKTFNVDDNDYENIKYLRHYRNAISHGQFSFVFNERWDKSYINFKDRNFQFRKTCEQFIIDYLKILKFIFTCNFLFLVFCFRCKNKGKPLSEMIKTELQPLIERSSSEMDIFRKDIKKSLKEIKNNMDNYKQAFKISDL